MTKRIAFLAAALALLALPARADYSGGVSAFARGDYATALVAFKHAARDGHVRAQFILGFMRRAGRGVARDGAQAARWYAMAAERGHVVAQFALGVMSQRGDGVARDPDRAVHWYRRAAARGHDGAAFALARLYHDGDGVPRDVAQALPWYRAAALQGHVAAQRALGLIYLDGDGVPGDVARAYLWLDRAARHAPDLRARRDALAGRLTPAQRDEARELAREMPLRGGIAATPTPRQTARASKGRVKILGRRLRGAADTTRQQTDLGAADHGSTVGVVPHSSTLETLGRRGTLDARAEPLTALP